MVSMAVLVGMALVLFTLAFFSKRRFGLLGLGLAVGFILSGLWHETVEFMVSAAGIAPSGVVTDFIATVVLILLPPAVLLFHGYAYKSLTGRIIGASLFTALAFAFLSNAITKAIVLDGPGLQIMSWLSSNADTVIGVGVMTAVFDVVISPSTTKYNARRKDRK